MRTPLGASKAPTTVPPEGSHAFGGGPKETRVVSIFTLIASVDNPSKDANEHFESLGEHCRATLRASFASLIVETIPIALKIPWTGRVYYTQTLCRPSQMIVITWLSSVSVG